MAAEMKTFKVVCAHCKLSFQVRYPLTGSDPEKKDDTGEVVISCLHCRKEMIVTIPRAYIASDALLRSVPR